MTNNVKEPTRPIGDAVPAPDGTLRAKTTMTPKACRVRARLGIPPSRVIPIIVVPGIMGTNLRAARDLGVQGNKVLKPEEVAWRPPNGLKEGVAEATKWASCKPAMRQLILDGPALEVDPNGPIEIAGQEYLFGIDELEARKRGWGEIHWASYGSLLLDLQLHFRAITEMLGNQLTPVRRWKRIALYDRSHFGSGRDGVLAPLTDAEILNLGEYTYPVYAVGYNWLLSNGDSAERLKRRITEIIKIWTSAGMACKQVILVTHSMGGLVARACAKSIPDAIAGIVHGCMPALGAPVCYRRLACGMESSSPSNEKIDNLVLRKVADVIGKQAADTTPVLAFSPGALELLPNHLYPVPWLFVSRQISHSADIDDVVRLPSGDPYAFYRDFDSWWRMIDPALADPGGKLGAKVTVKILGAITQAEGFHKIMR